MESLEKRSLTAVRKRVEEIVDRLRGIVRLNGQTTAGAGCGDIQPFDWVYSLLQYYPAQPRKKNAVHLNRGE
jgi:hypothetical protein